jgi:hypothetical protein
MIEVVETPEIETIDDLWDTDLYTEIPTIKETHPIHSPESDTHSEHLLDGPDWNH